MRKHLLACAALTAAVLAIPSSAAKLGQAPQVTVSYADLNLTRTEGANALLDRLRTAARRVCGHGVGDVKTLRDMSRYRDCYATTMDKAVAQVDDIMVATAYGKPEMVADRGATTIARADTGAPANATAGSSTSVELLGVYNTSH